MANAQSILLISLGFLIYLFQFTVSDSDSSANCPKTNTSIINFTSQFVMCQNQLRGSFTVINDCSFRVKEFDMLSGGSDVHWWGAAGDSYENLITGFVISDDKLKKTTYKNDTFTVNLMSNVTWDDIKVVSVWRTSTASNFGHVVLEERQETSYTPTPSLAPTPTPAPPPSDFTGSSVIKIDGEPTMFENCKVLSDTYRLRWTLRAEDNVIDIGLEGAINIQHYMAFGWADPSREHDHMYGADVAVTGFTDEGMPFVDDYYITTYNECRINKKGKAEGVCPDTMYVDYDDRDLVNNTMLVYGHRKDGVSFVRYQRPLKSIDKDYDWNVDDKKNMTCIWALGSIKSPGSFIPYYLPQNHGKTYGHVLINVSEHVNDCVGPLDAENKQDQDLVIADEKELLLVTSGPALHYPNPPNPKKVLYINKKESPLLRVERGVPIKFSVQAGHNVAFYITSDPLGGNATSRNVSETIYAGGPDYHGVPSKPKELKWAPDRNTPNHVYYQSFYAEKVGWKVQVVNGGLDDMYNNSVLLDDQQVTFFWTLLEKSISIAARGEKKSGYLAIGFGTKMVNSFVYVGWVDANGTGHVKTYWVDGMNAQSVHPTKEKLSYVRCKSEQGIITLEFTRPLDPKCEGYHKNIECRNIVEPTSLLKVIWAMGAKWSIDHLTQSNMHSETSTKPVRISLTLGTAEAEENLQPVLAVHGAMMFLAWGMFFPCGIVAARYMKHIDGDVWFKIHVYSQWSGLTISFLGILFAFSELRGLDTNPLHVKLGIFTLILGCLQPINAFLRPKKSDNGRPLPEQVVWEFIHSYCGRFAVFVGIFAIFSGMKHLGERYDAQNIRGLMWTLFLWISVGFMVILYLEYSQKRYVRERISKFGHWVLGNEEGINEETDLLIPSRIHGVNVGKLGLSSQRSEIQLEPLTR